MTHQLKVQGDSLGAHPPHMRLLMAQQPQKRCGAPLAPDCDAALCGPQGAGREQPCGRRPLELRQGRCSRSCAAGCTWAAIVGRREVEKLQGPRRSGEISLDQAAVGKVSCEQMCCSTLWRRDRFPRKEMGIMRGASLMSLVDKHRFAEGAIRLRKSAF